MKLRWSGWRARLGALGSIAVLGLAGAAAYLAGWPAVPAAALVAYLPPGDGATLYLNARALRQAGLFDRLAGAPGAEEPDYRAFLAETGFDYRRDLDAVAVRFQGGAIYYVVQGRIDRTRLAGYARRHGGVCAGDFCTLPASDPGRTVGFQPLAAPHWYERRLLGVAVSADAMAVAGLRAEPAAAHAGTSPAPVWLDLPAGMLEARPGLPLLVNGMLDALHGARHAVFSVEPAAERGGFRVVLRAACPERETAAAVAGRLNHAVGQLKALLAGAAERPAANDALTMLAEGRFEVRGEEVDGEWNVPAALIEQLTR
jgi:hypothetical protein